MPKKPTGKLLEPQADYAWPSIDEWVDRWPALAEVVPTLRPFLANDPFSRLYVSRGQDHEAAEAVLDQLHVWVYDPRVRAALIERKEDQRRPYAAVKREVFLTGLLLAVEDAFRVQTEGIRWGRAWMKDGRESAEPVPAHLNAARFRQWLRMRVHRKVREILDVKDRDLLVAPRLIEDKDRDLRPRDEHDPTGDERYETGLSLTARRALACLDRPPNVARAHLSPRLQQVYDLWAEHEDWTRRDLARALNVTPATVHGYLKDTRRSSQ